MACTLHQYSTAEQQIRAGAILSRQFYDEEQKQFKKQIRQIETQ